VVAAAAGDPRVAGLVLLGLPQWLRTGPRAMSRLWAALSPDRIDARLRTVRVPVTVVRGTRDRLCPHDWAAAVAEAAPRGRLAEIPGAAHLTPMTRPGQVAALVREAAAERHPGA
jgi:pimeloyl-ACP methyl ester carboxylesterase